MAAPHPFSCDESPRAAGGRCLRKSKIFGMTREPRSLEPSGIFSLEHPHRTALARIGPAQATTGLRPASSGRASSPDVPFASLTGPALALSVRQGQSRSHRPSRRGMFSGRLHRSFPGGLEGRGVRGATCHLPNGKTTREAGSRRPSGAESPERPLSARAVLRARICRSATASASRASIPRSRLRSRRHRAGRSQLSASHLPNLLRCSSIRFAHSCAPRPSHDTPRGLVSLGTLDGARHGGWFAGRHTHRTVPCFLSGRSFSTDS